MRPLGSHGHEESAELEEELLKACYLAADVLHLSADALQALKRRLAEGHVLLVLQSFDPL